MIYSILHSIKNTLDNLSDDGLIKLVGNWQGNIFGACITQ